MKSSFKIYIIYHTHTDIGYTDIQSKIKLNHYDYILQALKIMEKNKDFYWTLENFWLVDNFMYYASKKEKKRLIQFLKKGQMVLTGNYLNMTDLLHDDIYENKLKEYHFFKKRYKIQSKSALTCDVNGFKLGYMNALLAHGVTNLMTSVHQHHGLAPTFKTQNPYYIKIEDKQLLIWNNEHYLLGNDLGMVPKTLASYTIKDEFSEPLGTYTKDEEIKISEIRIRRYINRFREDETYPYDFVPILLSGQRIDNAAPNIEILMRIDELNEIFNNEEIKIQFISLDDLFEKIKENQNIPVYKGLFPDFWVDGVASTPKSLKLFRKTQHLLSLYKKIPIPSLYQRKVKEIEHLLTLYAEHTWGQSESVRDPYSDFVTEQLMLKEGYVVEAYKILKELMLVCEIQNFNGSYMKPNRPLTFIVYNPHVIPIEEIVTLSLDYFEVKQLENGLMIKDEEGHLILDDVDSSKPINKHLRVCVYLLPKQKKKLTIVPRLIQYISNIKFDSLHFENDWISINFKTSCFFYKKENLYLTNSDYFGLFHQISSSEDKYDSYRTELGLKRMGHNATNFFPKLQSCELINDTQVSSEIEIIYHIESMDEIKMLYKVFKKLERIDIEIKFLKKAIYDVEHLFFEIPFIFDEIYLINNFQEMRPWIDQVPGSLIDYYHTDYGIRLENKDFDIVILSKDNPLYFLGNNEGKGPHVYSQSVDLSKRKVRLWLMNNYWETNFNLDLSGFYQFKFSIYFDRYKRNSDFYRALSEGVIVVRT